MVQNTWLEHTRHLAEILVRLSFRDVGGGAIEAEEGFSTWVRWTEDLRRDAGTMYLVGNGASASMASHMAADVAKNAGIHTQVFSDLSLITAISNDIGYDEVFSVPLQRCAKAGDMLLAISSSGQSPNILNATRTAREMGVKIITLSGMKEENALRSSGDLNIWIPAATYGEVESAHAAILHFWMDRIEL